MQKNKAANEDHYPRAAGAILGKDSTTTTKSLVDSAALCDSRFLKRNYVWNISKALFHHLPCSYYHSDVRNNDSMNILWKYKRPKWIRVIKLRPFQLKTPSSAWTWTSATASRSCLIPARRDPRATCWGPPSTQTKDPLHPWVTAAR